MNLMKWREGGHIAVYQKTPTNKTPFSAIYYRDLILSTGCPANDLCYGATIKTIKYGDMQCGDAVN
jgi:hypothetical protein